VKFGSSSVRAPLRGAGRTFLRQIGVPDGICRNDEQTVIPRGDQDFGSCRDSLVWVLVLGFELIFVPSWLAFDSS
jgi:hypothetical protein